MAKLFFTFMLTLENKLSRSMTKPTQWPVRPAKTHESAHPDKSIRCPHEETLGP